jgi:hypothetical protein
LAVLGLESSSEERAKLDRLPQPQEGILCYDDVREGDTTKQSDGSSIE